MAVFGTATGDVEFFITAIRQDAIMVRAGGAEATIPKDTTIAVGGLRVTALAAGEIAVLRVAAA